MSRLLPFFLVITFFLTPALISASTGVFINEIAWMGTTEGSHNEWIELYNNSSTSFPLNGWILKIGEREIKLKGILEPKSFYLLERTDNNTLPGIEADLIYSGSLQNNGEKLTLINRNKKIIDEIDCRKGWLKGNNDTKRTMERKENSWQDSSKIGGTPKEKNSKGYSQKTEKYIDLNLANSNSIKYKNFFLILLIAFITSLFSTIIVLLIDKNIKKL